MPRFTFVDLTIPVIGVVYVLLDDFIFPRDELSAEVYILSIAATADYIE